MKLIFALVLLLPVMGWSVQENWGGLANQDPHPEFQIFKWDDRPTEPRFLDWRNRFGQNWVSNVRTQMGCGSCVAFAVASGVETQMIINSGISWWRPFISVQDLFFCGGGKCGVGWWPSSAFERLKTLGVPDESCSPYNPAGDEVALCQKSCSQREERAYKIIDAPSITNGVIDVNAIKAALIDGPVVAVMNVMSDFRSYRGWGVYKAADDAVPEVGHTVAIIGFDDSKKAWIIKNSWGSEWGDKGFGMIYYEDRSGIAANTWKIIADKPTGFVGIKDLPEFTVLTGVMKIKLESNRKDVTSLQLKISNPATQEFKIYSCNGLLCEVEINTSDFKDGAYELLTEAFVGGSIVTKGYIQRFAILNTKPSEFKWKTQTPKILKLVSAKGFVEFTVDTNSEFLPSTVEIKILRNGKKLISKTVQKTTGILKVKWWKKDSDTFDVQVNRKTSTPFGEIKTESLTKF